MNGEPFNGSHQSSTSFTPVGIAALPFEPRIAHTATLLPDGRLLVAGGSAFPGNHIASGVIYDSAKAEFTAWAPMTVGRWAHTATLLNNGKVLLVGGEGFNQDTSNSTELFDPSSNTFTAIPGLLIEGRYGHTATLLPNGKVLLAGGNNNGAVLASAEIFDPVTATFSSVAPMTIGRMFHTATLLTDGTVLIAGGYSNAPGEPSLATAEIFNPTTGTFAPTKSPMFSVRVFHTATLLPSGVVFVAGGKDNGNTVVATAECYDPSIGEFRVTASPMASPREGHSATLLPNGQVLLTGGNQGLDSNGETAYLADGELYTPAQDSFLPAAGSMNFMRSSHTATLLNNGQVLMIGGTDSSNKSIASSEIFDTAKNAFVASIPLTLGCVVTNASGFQSLQGTLVISVVAPVTPPVISLFVSVSQYGSTVMNPTTVCRGNHDGYVARVKFQGNCQYTWTISNGTITSGASSSRVTFTAGSVGTPLILTCQVTNATGLGASAALSALVIPGFVTISPATALLSPGRQQVFTANQPVHWSTSGYGTISPIGDGTSATYAATGVGVGTYSIYASSIADPTLSDTALVTVFVPGSPLINSFTANPTSIHAGQLVTLNWNVSNATEVDLNGVPVTGTSAVVTPTLDGQYGLSAWNSLGAVSAYVRVRVDQVPKANLLASAAKVNLGGRVVLTPTFSNGVGRIDPGAVPVENGVAVSMQPRGLTNYTLTVTNSYGATATSSTLVNVAGLGRYSTLPPPMLNYAGFGGPSPAYTLRDREGRVLVVGGHDPNVGGLSVERFDPVTNTWSNLGKLSDSAIKDFEVIMLPDDRMILFGGSIWSGDPHGLAIRSFNSDQFVFDTRTGVVSKTSLEMNYDVYRAYGLAGMDAPRSVLLSDGRVIVAGGTALPENMTWCMSCNFLPRRWISSYVPYTDKWTNITAFTQIDWLTQMIPLLDGRVLLFGYNNAIEVFDPLLGTCTSAGTFPAMASLRGHLRQDGKVLIAGKQTADNQYKLGVWDESSTTVQWFSESLDFDPLYGTQLQDGRFLRGLWDSPKALFDLGTFLVQALKNDPPGASGFSIGSPMQPLPSGRTLAILSKYDEINQTDQEAAVAFDAEAPLTVIPVRVQQNLGLPVQFSASGPATTSGLTWTSSGGGTVDANGLFQAAQPGLYAVIAKSGSGATSVSWVEVVPPISVTINPAGTEILFPYHAGQAWPLKVIVKNHPNSSVTWSLLEGDTAGTITVDGVYTAASVGTYHVVATSQADPTKSDTLIVNVVAPIQLSISPAVVSMIPGGSITLNTQEPNGSTWATWYANGIILEIGSSLDFIAPTTPGVYTVSAVSTLDPSKIASATITVVPVISATLNPSRCILAPNGNVRFKALINTSIGTMDVSNQVTWATTGGLIERNAAFGLYQAPPTPGIYTIQAFLAGSVLAQATATVLPSSSFVTANSPSIARGSYGFILTRLLDGRILITGGTKTAEIYNPIDKTFRVAIHQMMEARFLHSATLLPDGRVLLVGGGGSPATAELFDPVTETFAYTAHRPLVHLTSQAAVLLPDGKVLIAGGDVYDPGSSTHSYRTLELYDPISSSFLPAGFLTADRENPSALLLADGRVLISGGDHINYLPNTVDIFDFRTGLVSSAGPLQSTRKTPTLVQTNSGSIWVLGSQRPVNGQYPNEWFNPTLSGPTTLGGVLLGKGATGSELVDGSVWFQGLGVDPLDPFVPYLNNYKSMRFYPDSGSCEITQTSTSFYPNRGYQQTLLQTGEVLNVGGGDGYQDAKLYISDTAPNLAVFPRHLTLVQGRSWPFQASATGLSNPAVTWSIQEGTSGGTITTQGAYTAPFNSGTYHIVAASVMDGTVQAVAVVDVIDDLEMTILPSLIQLQPNATQTFQASLVGVSNPAVTWSSSGGNITAGGLLTAPMTEGTYTVTATSVAQSDHSATATVVVKAGAGGGGAPAPVLASFAADAAMVVLGQPVHLSWATLYASHLQLVCTTYMGYPGQFQSMDVSGQTRVTIFPGRTDSYQLKVTNASGLVTSQVISVAVWTDPVSIAITPTSTTSYVGGRQVFGYSLSAPTNRVVWTCSGGNITQAGSYTAPAVPGTYQVTIQSVDDPNRSAVATVMVRDILLTLTPNAAQLNPGQSLIFGYSFEGGDPSLLSWTATGGVINRPVYTAPSQPGTYVVALNYPPVNRKAQATIIVQPVTVSISPSTARIQTGSSKRFSALVSSGAVVWSVVGTNSGSITQDGIYSAPLVSGTFTIKAVSSLDPNQSGSATVSVGSNGNGGGSGGGPPITGDPGVTGNQVTVTPGSMQMNAGTFCAFSATVSGTGDPSVSWQVVNNPVEAQINIEGVFTASRHGNYQVKVSSVADPTASATVPVFVSSAINTSDNPLSAIRGYTLTALDNGKVLIVGGTSVPVDYNPATCSYLANAWLYDPETQVYSPTGNLLTGRSDHHAVKLQDGRVLIAGGFARWADPWEGASNTQWNGTAFGHAYPFAEIYNPGSGTFSALPVRTIGPLVGWELYHPGTLSGPGLMCDSHDSSSRVQLLPSRKVWFSGGVWGWGNFLGHGSWESDKGEGVEIFDPGTGLFSPAMTLSNGTIWNNHSHHSATPLGDGRLLVTRGLILGASGELGQPAMAGRNASFFDSAANTLEDLGQILQVGRLDATATTLPDGRILLVGGGVGKPTLYGDRLYQDGGKYNNSGDYMYDYYDFDDTASAEIFDPVTKTSTLVSGSLAQARRNHAAILLPTGQVLIVGGIQHAGSSIAYPNLVELFDPATGQFSVMDHLDYGLNEPKLALLNDGSVFVAGQVQAPMETPEALAAMKANKLMAAEVTSSLTTGTTLFGLIAGRTPIEILQVYPELFAKVKTDPAEKHSQYLNKDSEPRYSYRSTLGVQGSTPWSSGKLVSSISIPKGNSLALTGDIAPGGEDIDDYRSTNHYGRYYIVKVRRAPYSFTDDWAGFRMAIQMSVGGVQKDISPAGGYAIDPRPNPLPSPIVPIDFHNTGSTYYNVGGATQPEFYEIDTHDETITFNRKPIKTGYLISYYKVLVTFHGDQPSPYTWDETANEVPPGYFCDFSFKISGFRYFDPLSSPFKPYSSDSKRPSGQPSLAQTRQVALWPMPRSVWSTFGRRGTRVPMGGDFWVSLPTYNMLNHEAALSEADRKPWLQALKDGVGAGVINDVTYEHGGGHTGEHFSGNEIDMPPPNGTSFHLANGATDWNAIGEFLFNLLNDPDVDHFIYYDTVAGRASIFNQLPSNWQTQISQTFGTSWMVKWRVKQSSDILTHTDHVHISFKIDPQYNVGL